MKTMVMMMTIFADDDDDVVIPNPDFITYFGGVVDENGDQNDF